MYGGLRGRRERSTLGSRAARGAVGRMERSMGGPRYTSSAVCQEVETSPSRSSVSSAQLVALDAAAGKLGAGLLLLLLLSSAKKSVRVRVFPFLFFFLPGAKDRES